MKDLICQLNKIDGNKIFVANMAGSVSSIPKAHVLKQLGPVAVQDLIPD